MKHTIHVHQANMRQGKPAIIDRTYKRSNHSMYVAIKCPTCKTTAAEVIQTPMKDACGAHITIRATETALQNAGDE
jgi:phage FluMu protein Com